VSSLGRSGRLGGAESAMDRRLGGPESGVHIRKNGARK